MNIKPIRTKKDYEQALARLEVIFDTRKGTEQGIELEILGILVENYENEKFPVGFPDPVEAIKFRMEQHGCNQIDLANIDGLRNTGSEIINRERKLFLEMIRQLHDTLNIAAEVLFQAY
jgi:HTH-type transcriptional regulator/antitoxin HigA